MRTSREDLKMGSGHSQPICTVYFSESDDFRTIYGDVKTKKCTDKGLFLGLSPEEIAEKAEKENVRIAAWLNGCKPENLS